MSTEKKTESPKQTPKTAVSGDPSEAAKKGDVELTEEELKRATGGGWRGGGPAIYGKI
jgi:hypothetical protein